METVPAQTGRVRQMPSGAVEPDHRITASELLPTVALATGTGRQGKCQGRQQTEMKKRDTSDWQASLDRMHCFYKIKWKNQVLEFI